MKPRHVALVWCIFAVSCFVEAQIKTEKDLQRASQGKTVKPEERVSFKSDMPYPKAIEGLSEVTKKLLNKEIVDNSPIAAKEATKIDENIEGLYWRDALELILRRQGLWYLEMPDRIVVNTMDNISRMASAMQTSGEQTGTQVSIPSGMQMGGKAMVDSSEILARMREITISAIFLEINQSKLNESGMSFSIFRGSDLNLKVEFTGASRVSGGLSVEANPTPGKLSVDVTSALKIFESEQVGQILSRPQVTVREGSPGKVQIGQKLGFLSKDFQGNTVTQFYDFGTILEVTPKLYVYDKTPFIVLSLKVQKSSVVPGSSPPTANTTEATSIVTLLNGEETYLGGLYSINESTIREGIPLLKDLPWWVFGLRYLFGFDSKTETRAELIVLLKAELVPLLGERAAQRVQRDMLQDKLRDNQRDIDKRQGKRQ